MHILTQGDYDQMLSDKKSFLLFKHSITCSRSAMVKGGIEKRMESNPGQEISLLEIQNDKPFSAYIEEQTSIKHESPQMIAYKNGEPVLNEKWTAIDAIFLDQAKKIIRN